MIFFLLKKQKQKLGNTKASAVCLREFPLGLIFNLTVQRYCLCVGLAFVLNMISITFAYAI